MKRGIVLGLALAFAFAGARAQEKVSSTQGKAGAPAAVTLKGFIVDQSCGKGMSKKDNPMQRAASHSRDCALEDACSGSGYGIFSDGKWYTFDKNGSKMVKESVEKDKRERALAYEVTGTLDGTSLTLASLKATSMQAPPAKKEQKPTEMK